MANNTYDDVMSGKSDYNIRYSDLQNLILTLGFKLERQNGSHAIYYNKRIKEHLNIQKDGAKAKGYQVKQVRHIIEKHGL